MLISSCSDVFTFTSHINTTKIKQSRNFTAINLSTRTAAEPRMWNPNVNRYRTPEAIILKRIIYVWVTSLLSSCLIKGSHAPKSWTPRAGNSLSKAANERFSPCCAAASIRACWSPNTPTLWPLKPSCAEIKHDHARPNTNPAANCLWWVAPLALNCLQRLSCCLCFSFFLDCFVNPNRPLWSKNIPPRLLPSSRGGGVWQTQPLRCW